MFKRSTQLAAMFVMALMIACTTVPLLDQEVYAMRSVTAARQTSTAALRAGKITPDQEARNRKIFDDMAAAIKAAVAANNPPAVAAEKAKAEKFDPLKGQ